MIYDLASKAEGPLTLSQTMICVMKRHRDQKGKEREPSILNLFS